jgi:hypothetical protein
LLAHVTDLVGQLLRILQVQQPASTAQTEVTARRLDPMWRGFDDIDNVRHHVSLPPSGYARAHKVARESSISQDDHPADPRDPASLVPPVIDGQVDQFTDSGQTRR